MRINDNNFFDNWKEFSIGKPDEIILNPFGLVYLEGYKNYRFYLKEALNKLNINVNTFVAGDYKSASEIFTNESIQQLYAKRCRALW